MAATADELERLRREYERYAAKVEAPLSNVDEATAQRTQAALPGATWLPAAQGAQRRLAAS